MEVSQLIAELSFEADPSRDNDDDGRRKSSSLLPTTRANQEQHAPSPTKAHKSVRFQDTLWIYPLSTFQDQHDITGEPDDDDSSRMWYSWHDLERIRQDNANAAWCHAHHTPTTPNFDACCRGLEHLANPLLAEQILQERAQLLHALLTEQELQRTSSSFYATTTTQQDKEEALRDASLRISRFSEHRAQYLAQQDYAEVVAQESASLSNRLPQSCSPSLPIVVSEDEGAYSSYKQHSPVPTKHKQLDRKIPESPTSVASPRFLYYHYPYPKQLSYNR